MLIIKNKCTWIDIGLPNEQDINYLRKEYKLPPNVLEGLTEQSPRQSVNKHGDLLYTVIHFPFWEDAQQLTRPLELDVILTKDTIITVRYENNIEPIEQILANCAPEEIGDKYLYATPYVFLEKLLETYFEYCDREIRHINDKLTAVEQEILDRHTPDNILVLKLAVLKRDILSFRRIASLNRNIIDSLKIMGTAFYGKDSEAYFDILANDSFKMNNTIEGFSDIINSLESTFNTLVSTEVNRLTRAYTYISLFIWPALLVFAIYQINGQDLPLINLPFSWVYVLSLGAALSVIVFTILKKKNII
ncbi:MAG TPA: CorA family divalent cation transporter [Candidatus Paceibacterota bacterium]|nr:CorA family divalent cation transporter [Candidatus Paceibacterota bacterium]